MSAKQRMRRNWNNRRSFMSYVCDCSFPSSERLTNLLIPRFMNMYIIDDAGAVTVGTVEFHTLPPFFLLISNATVARD